MEISHAQDMMVAVICQAFLQADPELEYTLPVRTSFPSLGAVPRSWKDPVVIEAQRRKRRGLNTIRGTVCIRLS